MAIGIAKTPLAKNRVFNRSDPIWNTLEELLLNLCVYFITSACGTSMGGKGLSCFFDQTCIDQLRLILNETSSFFYELNTTALDASLPTRYSAATKIDEIINHVML